MSEGCVHSTTPGWTRSGGGRPSTTLVPSSQSPGPRSRNAPAETPPAMADVRFLPAAAADYQDALAWYQARSPQAAAGFEAAVEVALRQIADAPERWTRSDDRHR